MSAEMDVIEALKKQGSKKTFREKTVMRSRSHVLEKIIDSLENEQYRHMLFWDDKKKNEFIIKFVHMNNPEWKTADYLELFKELDRLSNNYKKYLQDEKYDHKCKVRCKANLRKLVESKALIFMGKTYKGKSIQLRKYKLNFDVTSVKSAVSKCGKMTTRSNVNGFNGCETVPLKTGITYIKGKLKIENLPNEQSHCLCLSNFNPINIYVNIPVLGTSISSASLVGPPLLDTCCTTENRNEDTRNVILQIQPLTVYEHEKQMDENDDALHVMSIEDPALYSSSISCSSIKENDKCELMGYCKLLDQKAQGIVEIQNNGALPTNSTESLNMESVGKIDLLNCNGPVEEVMGAINLANTHYTSSGYNDLQYSNNSPNGLQIESFQDMDSESKNYAQLVPSSPLNFGEILNDLLSQRSDVYMPLQQDNDPFWSDINSDCNANLLEENESLMANNEDLFSFGNIDSSDAVQ